MKATLCSILVLLIIGILVIGLGVPSALAANKMLSLDGDGDYVSIQDAESFRLSTNQTIEFEINPDESPPDWSRIVGKGIDKRNYGVWLSPDLRILYQIGTHSEWFNFFTNAPLSEANWYHIACTYDGNFVSIYINGNLDMESESTIVIPEITEDPLTIGYAGVHSYLDGTVDEIRIWNTTRTQEQIQENMNQSLENPESEPNLVGYWNFDSGTADDLSQYGNHGTLRDNATIVDIIYVSPTGSDETGDGTQANPYRTIQKGINESGRNDIVQVLPGVYEENISLFGDLTVLGSGTDNTTITAASGNVVTVNNVHNVTFSEFTIDGQGSADNGIVCSGTTTEMEISNNVITGASEVGIACSDFVNVNIKNNSIEKNGIYGIRCSVSAHSTIENNVIRQNTQAGVECSDSTDITIYNNNIEENMLRGVQCNGNAKVGIMNNNIRRNQDRGVSCWNTANVTIQYNVISQNNWAAYCTESSVVKITDNLIYNNIAPEIVLAGSSNTTIIRNIIRNHNAVIIHCHETAEVLIGGSLTGSNNIASGATIHNWASTTINATYNYWGTTNESEIAAMMKNYGNGSINFIPFVGDSRIIGDTTGDGTISALDAALILQYVVGLIDQFPANNPISQVAQKYISGEITIVELDRILQQLGYPSIFQSLGVKTQLLPNYPNPFNPETWIPYQLSDDSTVVIHIYNIKGQLIRTIQPGNRKAGVYVTKDKAAYWNGRNQADEPVTSGIYLYSLQAGKFTAIRRMVILK